MTSLLLKQIIFDETIISLRSFYWWLLSCYLQNKFGTQIQMLLLLRVRFIITGLKMIFFMVSIIWSFYSRHKLPLGQEKLRKLWHTVKIDRETTRFFITDIYNNGTWTFPSSHPASSMQIYNSLLGYRGHYIESTQTSPFWEYRILWHLALYIRWNDIMTPMLKMSSSEYWQHTHHYI